MSILGEGARSALLGSAARFRAGDWVYVLSGADGTFMGRVGGVRRGRVLVDGEWYHVERVWHV